MDIQKKKSTQKRKISLKGVDNCFLLIKRKALSKLSCIGNVISDNILPQQSKELKKSLKGKSQYIQKSLFYIIISFLLGLSSVNSQSYPFGISTLFSFTVADFAYYILSGTLLSSLFIRPLSPVPITVYFLIFLLRKTFTSGKYNEPVYIKTICAFIFSLFVSISSCYAGGINTTAIFSAIFNSTVSGCAVYLFHSFFTPSKKSTAGIHTMSLYAVFACTIPAFRYISPFGIDLSLIYAGVLVLFFSKIKGPVYGCVSGFIFGFLCSDPLFCAPLGCAGLICGYLFTKSFLLSCIAFTCTSFFCSFYLFGFSCLSGFLPFVFTSSLIFMLIGNYTPKIFSSVQILKKEEQKDSSCNNKETSFGAVCDSLTGLSNILYKFAEHLKSPSHAETGDIFDNAFNEVCSTCSMNSMCYAKRECCFEKMRENVIEILRTDILKEEKLSSLLLGKCIRSTELCDYINRHYAELRFLTMKANRTGTVACLYNSMSHLIRTTEKEEWSKNTRDVRIEKCISDALRKIGIEFSHVSCTGARSKEIAVFDIRADKIPCSGADLSKYLSKQCHLTLKEPVFDISQSGSMIMKISRREVIGCEYAQCSASKENEDVNGDTVSFFDSDASYFYSIIADGMGSGKSAAATSRLTCVFLEKLLHAGTKKNVCLELLNNLLLSKNDETFSSVDLLEIDKLNSSAYFIKAGAASSYILRGMKLYKIRSETPPVGIIHAFSAESTSFPIEKGDIIIMLSDGVSGNESDEKWLSEIIRIDTKDEPAVLASSLIDRAKNVYGAKDDMSAVVIKII